MRVKVKLFADLATQVPGIEPGIPFEVELPHRSSLSDLVRKLGLSETEMKVVFVNGRTQASTYELMEDDEVGVFPPIGGG